MSDYRVRISVRNARLLRAIKRAGHRPGPQFADLVGIDYGTVLLPYLNLTRSPLNRGGLIRECAWALCDYLGASPSDLWSDAQMDPLEKNHSSLDLDAARLQALIFGKSSLDDPMRLASHDQVARILKQSIGMLTPNQADVIRERFFGGLTLEEVGEQLGVTGARIRQIEGKALRRLRQFYVPPDLAGTADIIGGAEHD